MSSLDEDFSFVDLRFINILNLLGVNRIALTKMLKERVMNGQNSPFWLLVTQNRHLFKLPNYTPHFCDWEVRFMVNQNIFKFKTNDTLFIIYYNILKSSFGDILGT